MQTFIYGLLLAAVSATSVVAFKHPLGYSRLFPYLLGIVSTVFAGLVVWHIAVEVTWDSLVPFVSTESLDDAQQTKAGLGLSYLWIGLWYLGVVVFLWVNLLLPPFLRTADEHQARIRKKNAH